MEDAEKSSSPQKHSAGVRDKARIASPWGFYSFFLQETIGAENTSNGSIHKPQPSRQVGKKDDKSNSWERGTNLQFGIGQNPYPFEVGGRLQP